MLNYMEIQSSQFPYLLHPYRAVLVTCIDREGKPNIISIAWIVPLSRNPPLLGVAISPKRYSYKLIMDSGEFVVNIPTFSQRDEVMFCGSTSGATTDKFKEAKLTPAKAKKVKAPIISECIAHIECQVEKTVETGDHTLFVGRVLAAYVREGIFDRVYDLDKAKPLLHVGGSNFTTTE